MNPIEPYSSRSEGNVGVLLLHGFTGSPASMRPWAEQLTKSNLAVELPVLPGHGSNWRDLNRTSWHQWYASAKLALLKLRADNEKVFIAGLSMGGALALRLAQHERDVAGLILVNPALKAKNKLLHFAPMLSKIIPSVPAVGDDIAKPGITEHSYDRTPVAAAASMLDLWVDVKKGLHLIDGPIQIFTSVNDHVVPPSSSELILTSVATDTQKKHHILLEKSFHVATLDYDQELIFQKSLDFIKTHTS
jgi:carboxylesterase